MSNWKSDLANIWDALDVLEFLKNIQVDYQENFMKSLDEFQGDNPYQAHIWAILPHPLIPSGVLHAYPARNSQKNKIWEEWFLLDGSIHHHVLSQLKLQQTQGEWMGEITDADHPKEVLGINWYYHNDLDHRPFYLR